MFIEICCHLYVFGFVYAFVENSASVYCLSYGGHRFKYQSRDHGMKMYVHMYSCGCSLGFGRNV